MRRAVLLAVLGGLVVAAASRSEPPVPAPARASVLPSESAIAAARRFARGRRGVVAFAVADRRGRIVCHDCRRRFPSASLSKAMLLVADLTRAAAAGAPVTARQRRQLAKMVRESDNDAADAVYARTGDAALVRVARRAGMRHFRPSGFWSEAQVTALDQARLFARLDSLLPRAHRAFARRLLRTVVAAQAWGVPAAVRPGWTVLFKGAWRPSRPGRLVHQVARLERGREMLAIAILTDDAPYHEYGTSTVRGIAHRLVP